MIKGLGATVVAVALCVAACRGNVAIRLPIAVNAEPDLGVCAVVADQTRHDAGDGGADKTATCERRSPIGSSVAVGRFYVQRIPNRHMVPFLWSDSARLTLVLNPSVQCARVSEGEAGELGYDSPRDVPSRRDLELEPAAGRVSFVLDADPGRSTEPARALGELLGSLQDVVEVDTYTRPCAALCAFERGTFTLRLDPARGISAFTSPETTSCRLVGGRAVSRLDGLDATANIPTPRRDAGAHAPIPPPDAGAGRG